MIVGTTNVKYDELKRFVNNPADIIAYSDSHVPAWARHIKPIVLNQRYFYALHIRKMLTVPYKKRMALVDVLLNGVTIKGVVNNFTAITTIVDSCDKDQLINLIKERLSNEENW